MMRHPRSGRRPHSSMKEETRASGESKRDLAGSAQDLRRLAERVEKKSVRSESELNESLARAEYALARQYHIEASESWAKKETSKAGARLKAAAGHLDNALALGGQPDGRKDQQGYPGREGRWARRWRKVWAWPRPTWIRLSMR